MFGYFRGLKLSSSGSKKRVCVYISGASLLSKSSSLRSCRSDMDLTESFGGLADFKIFGVSNRSFSESFSSGWLYLYDSFANPPFALNTFRVAPLAAWSFEPFLTNSACSLSSYAFVA